MKLGAKQILILCFLIALGGCYRQGGSLVFVVPDGFTGILKLRQSPNGIVPRATNNVVELIFAADGICEVQGELPTREWHQKNPRYATSGPITWIPFPDETPTDAVGMRSVGTKNSGEDWFVIGTHSDATAALEKMTGIKWPTR